MLGFFSLAVLSMTGLGNAQTTLPQPTTLTPGDMPVSTSTYETGGGVANVPIYSEMTTTATPGTSYECWRVSDYGDGVVVSIPVPTYIISDGSIATAYATSGVQCYEGFSTGGGWAQIPVPTAAANVQPSSTTSSRRLPLRVLLPSIIVPICSIALLAIVAVILRRRVVKSTAERRWVTLKEEEINTSDKIKTPRP